MPFISVTDDSQTGILGRMAATNRLATSKSNEFWLGPVRIAILIVIP